MNDGHWNGLVPVGTPVRYWPTLEPEYVMDYLDTETTSEAKTDLTGVTTVHVRQVLDPVPITHLLVRAIHVGKGRRGTGRMPVGSFVNTDE